VHFCLQYVGQVDKINNQTSYNYERADSHCVKLLVIIFTLGCIGCYASKIWHDILVYLVAWCKQAHICND